MNDFEKNRAKALRNVTKLDGIDKFKHRDLRTIYVALEAGLKYPETNAHFDALVMLGGFDREMSTETQLAVYDAMVLAIDECYKVDEIKDWRDKALALEEYARQACNMKAEWRAAEVRIRAERKAGQLLKEIEREQGKRTSVQAEPKSSETEYQRVKKDAHISDTQAKRWQQLAALPHGEFEGRLHNPLIKPTTSGIISKYKQPPDDILHLWGIMKDLERDGYLEKDINEMINQMLPKMKLDMKRIMPEVKKWIHKYNGRNKHNRRSDNQDG